MSENVFERIGQYLDGSMPPEEKMKFEEDLKHNEELASLFAVQQAIENKMPVYTANGATEEALKGTITQLNQVFFSNTQKIGDDRNNSTRVLWRWLLAAASVGGITIAAFMLLTKPPQGKKVAIVTPVLHADTAIQVKQPANQNNAAAKNDAALLNSHKALYAANFKPDDAPENTDGPLQDAFYYYQSGDYKQAAAEFANADYTTQTRGAGQDTLVLAFYSLYYGALSNMAAGNHTQAQAALQKAMAINTGNLLTTKAKWYLALSYLDNGEAKTAQVLLNQVAGSKIPGYHLKAANLVKSLQAQ